jgi:hypothetical protein
LPEEAGFSKVFVCVQDGEGIGGACDIHALRRLLVLTSVVKPSKLAHPSRPDWACEQDSGEHYSHCITERIHLCATMESGNDLRFGHSEMQSLRACVIASQP